ncbi:RagB/SusD family nutrient uptake outer membrane protein [Parafilimonas sp.]|uniref:RagB/SusD family nutrient uptake outer membrane protein n=1 Tax=Parafilimonas sp. TaxID=1969739 RepID=UPI0039E612A1
MKPNFFSFIQFLLGVLICLGAFSCKKDWLNVKSDKSLVVPNTISDYQAILDNTFPIFNVYLADLGEIGSDDYHITDADWQSLNSFTQKNAYIWASDVYEGENVNDWSKAYQRIFYANVALDGINSITPTASTEDAWANIKGSALFCRAFDHFNSLEEEFSKPYNQATANTDLGVPLRLTSDINAKSVRATTQQTYDQIIADLKQAASLLPNLPLFKTRPSKACAFALLARVYLTMSDFSNALLYSDSCLQIDDSLLDYNQLDTTVSYPIQRFNDEVIYQYRFFYDQILRPDVFIVDSNLYRRYSINDLRRKVFFTNKDGTIRYKGSYDGSVQRFGGIATDEIYLIRAECQARMGNTSAAMQDLNTLYKSRWDNSVLYVPLSATDAADALQQVISERRKELCFRGLRWMDLRRLNQDPNFAVTLTRVINGQTYTLPPNDNRYTYAIPDQEIQISGIQQNQR